MSKECNNISQAHILRQICETDAIRVICEICHHQYVLRKDHRGVPEKRLYAKIFKRDVLQGNDNLFYKYYPQYLRQ